MEDRRRNYIPVLEKVRVDLFLVKVGILIILQVFYRYHYEILRQSFERVNAYFTNLHNDRRTPHV